MDKNIMKIMKKSMGKLTDPDEAKKMIMEKWEPSPAVESVSITESVGRVLAEDQLAEYDLPVFRAAGMDGVAFAYDKYVLEKDGTGSWKAGSDYVRADTGDDFPDDYDTVVPVETVTFTEEGGILIDDGYEFGRGNNIRGKGSMLKKGALLAPAGRRIRAQEIGAFAMGGKSKVPVFRKPVTAFIPTGSELIPAGGAPERGQNIDSNSVMVREMIKDMGGEPLISEIIKDVDADLEKALDSAVEKADIVVINGGSSKGSEDLNTRLLKSKGEFLFHQVAAVPGRPMSAAIINGKPVINVPGPAMAAFYGFYWMIRPLICRWYGIPVPAETEIECILAEDMKAPPVMAAFKTCDIAEDDEGTLKARPRGRGDGTAGIAAEGFFVTEKGKKEYKAGEKIKVKIRF